MNDTPLALVPGKTDAETAAELREALKVCLNDAAKIMERARAAGLVVSWNIGPDSFGRFRVNDINIVRPL